MDLLDLRKIKWPSVCWPKADPESIDALGEDTGAALAMILIEGEVKVLNEMVALDKAGVSDTKQ